MTQRIWNLLYTWIALPLLLAVLRLYAFKDKKVKDSLSGRHGLWERLDQQIVHRNLQQPLVWFHVVSAGEYLQAEPVIERCLQEGYDCALTVSSVTGYKWAKRAHFPNDLKPLVIEFLPFDFPFNIRRILAILQPAALVYVKFDLWPNLIWQANAQGIPQFLISATLQPRSLRLTSALGRSFYGTIYACLDAILSVSEEEAQRFRITNPDHPNIKIAGDTRFDSVLDRKERLPQPELPSYVQDKFVFIVGSSWPPDEECIFPALAEALREFPDLLLIIAPHEPTTEHLSNTESFFKDFKIERFTKLEKTPKDPPRIILIDTVGVLSSLYFIGKLAYVGGSFTTGVHNVMEPCVMGMPVIFGPVHYNSPEALDLLEKKFAFTVKVPEEFREILFRLLQDRTSCEKLGQDALKAIEAQGGAAEKCFQLLKEKIQ
ncbi:MAG: 3-deoxy-D-manno-octulosonic acid transferase [SAR324 cluster bacterium]|nr:3-deoxy-D-manno-octulosonic acid transferase [SAR324 cluster bacterium]